MQLGKVRRPVGVRGCWGFGWAKRRGGLEQWKRSRRRVDRHEEEQERMVQTGCESVGNVRCRGFF